MSEQFTQVTVQTTVMACLGSAQFLWASTPLTQLHLHCQTEALQVLKVFLRGKHPQKGIHRFFLCFCKFRTTGVLFLEQYIPKPHPHRKYFSKALQPSHSSELPGTSSPAQAAHRCPPSTRSVLQEASGTAPVILCSQRAPYCRYWKGSS